MSLVDCVYVAASALDARFTRICVASIRFFYPEIPIRLLIGGRLQQDLAAELLEYWGVEATEIPAAWDYGWGFVKLEVLFGPPGERFLVLDSDTVLTGRVLDLWTDSRASFLVDDEAQSEERAKAIYYDWEKVRQIDPWAQPPRFLFNTGQWFGTAGILTREDFAPWLMWTMPRMTTPANYFMNGDQGILNYVFNQKAALQGLPVERLQIMRWPGHSMDGLDAESVSKRVAPPLIVHWAGMKKILLRDMIGGDILLFFEKFYYSRLPGGSVRRLWANCLHVKTQTQQWVRVRLKLTFQKRIKPAICLRLSRDKNTSVEL